MALALALALAYTTILYFTLYINRVVLFDLSSLQRELLFITEHPISIVVISNNNNVFIINFIYKLLLGKFIIAEIYSKIIQSFSLT